MRDLEDDALSVEACFYCAAFRGLPFCVVQVASSYQLDCADPLQSLSDTGRSGDDDDDVDDDVGDDDATSIEWFHTSLKSTLIADV